MECHFDLGELTRRKKFHPCDKVATVFSYEFIKDDIADGVAECSCESDREKNKVTLCDEVSRNNVEYLT